MLFKEYKIKRKKRLEVEIDFERGCDLFFFIVDVLELKCVLYIYLYKYLDIIFVCGYWSYWFWVFFVG